MTISRRNLLRNLTAGVAAAPALRGLSIAAATELALWGNSIAAAAGPDPILLYRNENPYGPSQKVLAVMNDSVSLGNRYPRTEYDDLVHRLAALHKVDAKQIIVGCGSGEILCMSAIAFLGSGKKLIFPQPTFPSLGNLAKSSGTQIIEVPLNKKYEHDLPAMLAHCDDSTSLVYVCNPNNPTGTITPRKDIEQFISRLSPKTMVLIDEAYHHFPNAGSGYESFLDNPVSDPRIIVARTFSKIYGLAGMRIGYAVTSTPEMAKRLSAGFPGWSISVVSARAASAALDDVDYVRMGIQRNAADRQEFLNQAKARKVYAIESQTNFIMLDPQRPPDGVIAHLKKNDILIGPKYPVLDKFIRVSLGTPPEMQAFWRAWDALPAAKS